MLSAGRRVQQKVLCHACPLFVEHQEYKYKYWHWVSLPLTGIIVLMCLNLFQQGYILAANFLDVIITKIVTIGGLPANFTHSTSGLADSPFQYLLLGVLAILLASYIVALTDMIFLKWKL